MTQGRAALLPKKKKQRTLEQATAILADQNRDSRPKVFWFFFAKKNSLPAPLSKRRIR
jgi:hypothetical protein